MSNLSDTVKLLRKEYELTQEELAMKSGLGLRFVRTVEYDYPHFHLTMHCFLCHLRSGHLTLIEHKASRWLSPSDLHSVRWLPADIAVVDNLIKKLHSHK